MTLMCKRLDLDYATLDERNKTPHIALRKNSDDIEGEKWRKDLQELTISFGSVKLGANSIEFPILNGRFHFTMMYMEGIGSRMTKREIIRLFIDCKVGEGLVIYPPPSSSSHLEQQMSTLVKQVTMLLAERDEEKKQQVEQEKKKRKLEIEELINKSGSL